MYKFRYKMVHTALIIAAMAVITSCGRGGVTAEPETLLKSEYDKITYNQGNLIKTESGGEETWYCLTGNEMSLLTVPDGMTPWKREEGFVWITGQNRKQGIIGLDGQIILPCEYDKIDYHPEGSVLELYVRTDRGMQRGFCDTAGNLIYPLLSGNGNEIKIVSEHAFLVQQDYEYFMIDRKGQRISPDTYSYGVTLKGCGYAVLGDMSYVGKPGYKRIYKDDGTPAVSRSLEFVELTGHFEYPFLAREQEGDKACLLTAEGDKVLEDYAVHTTDQEEALMPLTEKLVYYRSHGKQYILDVNGTIVLQASYGPLSDGTYPAGRLNMAKEPYGLLYGDDRWIVIDRDGNEILKEASAGGDIMLYQGGTILLEYGYETEYYRLYNLDTEKVIYESETWDDLTVMRNCFAVKAPEGYRVFDSNGKAVSGLQGVLQIASEADGSIVVISEGNGRQGVYCVTVKP